MINYNKLMKKCISFAKRAEGKTSPNPLVGAIVLDKYNNIVGVGWHKIYGDNHAEVNALDMAGNKAENGTLIVNLEPCAHFGKTPPCCDLIIEKKIKKVVIGNIDPNPLVCYRGIEKLKKAGIEVVTGVLEKDCEILNEIFFENILNKHPFVAIKTATTLDGKIATKNGQSKWITSSKSRKYVQKLRNRYDAILTSSNTVLMDNPGLLCNMKNGKNPIRIVLDTNLKTSPNSKVYNNDNVDVYIFTCLNPEEYKHKYNSNVKLIKAKMNQENKIDLLFLFDYLFSENINSVLIEAGGHLNGAIIKQNLCNKLYHFIAPKIMSDKDAINWAVGCDIFNVNNLKQLQIEKIKMVASDVLIEAYFKNV